MHRVPTGQYFRKLRRIDPSQLHSYLRPLLEEAKDWHWLQQLQKLRLEDLLPRWLLSSLTHLTSGMKWLMNGRGENCKLEHLYMTSPCGLIFQSVAGRSEGKQHKGHVGLYTIFFTTSCESLNYFKIKRSRKKTCIRNHRRKSSWPRVKQRVLIHKPNSWSIKGKKKSINLNFIQIKSFHRNCS